MFEAFSLYFNSIFSHIFCRNENQSDLDKFLISKNVQSTSEVEYWTERYQRQDYR